MDYYMRTFFQNPLHLLFRSGDHRGLTHVAEFAQKYNLGAPEFGNFYQAPYDTYSDILQKQLEG